MQTATTPDAAPVTHPRSSEEGPGALPAWTSLDALLDADASTLEALYRGARTPRLEDVTGELRGRLLAIPLLPAPLAALPRALSRLDWFPWRGKSFSAATPQRGGGDNRVVTDRFHLFRFATFIARSRAGDFDALQLDYDNPANPGFIRAIKDEIRELSPGVYLGQAYLALHARAPKLVLYFGLTKGA